MTNTVKNKCGLDHQSLMSGLNYRIAEDREWKTDIKTVDLFKAKIIAITLATPDSNKRYRPVQKIKFDINGTYLSQKVEEDWGEDYCTFPPALKNLTEVSEWSHHLLKDCYGYGDIIEQRICVLERYK